MASHDKGQSTNNTVLLPTTAQTWTVKNGENSTTTTIAPLLADHEMSSSSSSTTTHNNLLPSPTNEPNTIINPSSIATTTQWPLQPILPRPVGSSSDMMKLQRLSSLRSTPSLSHELDTITLQPRHSLSSTSVLTMDAPTTSKPSAHPSPRLWGKAGLSLPDVSDMIHLNNNNLSTPIVTTSSTLVPPPFPAESPPHDMEDIIPASTDDQSESDLLEELTYAAPRVNVTPETVHDQTRCEICQRHDCPTLHPPVGYYSARQVAMHAVPGDCWITANSLVYDVSRYIARHPGGVAPLLKRGGHDATEDYKFHSSQGKRLWKRLEVGYLVTCPYGPPAPPPPPARTISPVHRNDNKTPVSKTPPLPVSYYALKSSGDDGVGGRHHHRQQQRIATPVGEDGNNNNDSCVLT